MNVPSWCYNEFHIVGRDYGAQEEVAIYDATHADFREIEAESKAVLDRLGVRAGDVLVDFGAGTGIFALEAAKRGLRVHAVDVSAAMLDLIKEKAATQAVSGLTFHHAGFLTYEHTGPAADFLTSTFALHHLPDFWKGIALERMHGMLKPGGLFYLHDVILEAPNALANVAAFIQEQEKVGGDFLREDAEGHFREEFSTYDWVMDGMLARAGFRVIEKEIRGGVLGTYLGTT